MQDMANDHPLIRRVGYTFDATTSVHDMLNDATEWLQYAQGLTELLSELMHEPEPVNARHMETALGAIGALMNLGVQCALEAHERMAWEEHRTEPMPLMDEKPIVDRTAHVPLKTVIDGKQPRRP